MSSSLRFAGIAAFALVGSGCGLFGGQFEEDVDCTDECDGGENICTVESDDGFDYKGYTADCSAADDQSDFCGVSDDEDCVEPPFELEEATIADIHRSLEDGEISCEWLTGEYIRRILWHDLHMTDGSPPLNAFVHLNEQATETARRLDDYQQCEGELAGPLHCVPFAIKTNYSSEEVPLTHGSLALEDPQPTSDAFTVEQLRSAGGITLGTTAMDEFAAGAQGLSGRSGKTGNAYDTEYTSGGSSAGSGTATAANLTMGALGTDNCSSVTIPASYNNLFTIRSSHQLISTNGIFPTNALDAIAGPLTRSAGDLILFFDQLATFDPHHFAHCDDTISHDELSHDIDYTEAMNPDGLEGKRIGVLEQAGANEEEERLPFGAASGELETHFEEFFDELEQQGAEMVEGIELDELSLDRSGSGSGWRANRFLEDIEGGVSDYEELCETERYSQLVFDDKDQCLNRADQSSGSFERNLNSGLETYRDNRSYAEKVMDEHDVDALVYPADRRGAPRRQYTATMCVVSSVTGLPTVIVPTGFSEDGLPIGMSFTGRMFDDFELLEMAYAYDEATDHRHAPDMPELQGEPPVDIEEFEHVHYELGVEAYEEVLRDNDKYDLTADVFEDIARDVLEDRGLEEFIDE